MRKNEFYDPKEVLKYLGFFVLLGVAMKFTSGAAFVVMIPYALLALSKRDANGVFWAVLVSVMSIDANSWLMPKGFVYAVAQRGLMASLGCIMIFQITGQRNSPLTKPLLPILLYIFYMIPVSMKGWSPIISGLKLFLFFVVFIALYVSANGAINTKSDVRRVRNMLLAMSCFFVIGSLLVLPFPSISYMGAEELINNPDAVSLYKGMTGHSQSLGPIMAMIGILVFADLVFTIQRPDKLYVALMLIVPFMIVKTSSRTAMGAFIAGVGIVSYQLMKAKGIRIQWRNKVLSGIMGAVALGSIVILAIPQTRESVAKFVVKYGNGDNTMSAENILKSRESKLSGAIANWKKSPYFGNGFQVSEDMAYFQVNSIADILSAPVEKCTWTHAILEEGGVIGEIIFVLFLLVSIPVMFKRQCYVGGAMFVAMVVVNLGEFTIFSMSGTGGFFWELVFLGCVIDAKRIQAKKQRGMMPFEPMAPYCYTSMGYGPMWR